jgi:ligand-binding sensor domain-containing protein
MVRDSVLCSYRDSKWQKHTTSYKVNGLCPTDQHLFILPKNQAGVAIAETDLSLQMTDMGIITDIVQDGSSYWWASVSSELVRGADRQAFRPDGPINNIAYRMRTFGDRLYVVPGGRWATQNKTPGEIMFYENGTWTNISNAQLNEATGTTILDLMNVAQDPNDKNHYFVTSYGTGLLEMYEDDVINLYTPNNSSLTSAVENKPETYTRTDGAMFDEQGNLWVLNTSVNNNVHIMDAHGNSLAAYDIVSNGVRIPLYTPGEILVDRRNTQWKWIPICRGNSGVAAGLLLLQDNGTPLNSKDDKVTYRTEWYDQNKKQILPESVFSMAQDRDNTLWVGTNAGLFLIPSTIDFITSNQCERVIISRNDGTQLGDYLLDNEQINHIVVDGANRKWIATATSGVFLLSPNGEETIEHFTAENSPLPSNTVLSIAILKSTGEVFFGTSQGLVSYMSDAIEPAKNFSDIYAYPNPVHPNYHGVVTIRGLMANTEVRIMDASGNLVATIFGNGGEVVWDMTNTQGNRVASGIYTVLSNTADGSNHGETKIMIMN